MTLSLPEEGKGEGEKGGKKAEEGGYAGRMGGRVGLRGPDSAVASNIWADARLSRICWGSNEAFKL